MTLVDPDTSIMKTYVRRPIRVDAIRFDGTNDADLADMCGFGIRRNGSGVWVDDHYVTPGEWVVAGIDDIRVMSHADFALHYCEDQT